MLSGVSVFALSERKPAPVMRETRKAVDSRAWALLSKAQTMITPKTTIQTQRMEQIK